MNHSDERAPDPSTVDTTVEKVGQAVDEHLGSTVFVSSGDASQVRQVIIDGIQQAAEDLQRRGRLDELARVRLQYEALEQLFTREARHIGSALVGVMDGAPVDGTPAPLKSPSRRRNRRFFSKLYDCLDVVLGYVAPGSFDRERSVDNATFLLSLRLSKNPAHKAIRYRLAKEMISRVEALPEDQRTACFRYFVKQNGMSLDSADDAIRDPKKAMSFFVAVHAMKNVVPELSNRVYSLRGRATSPEELPDEKYHALFADPVA